MGLGLSLSLILRGFLPPQHGFIVCIGVPWAGDGKVDDREEEEEQAGVVLTVLTPDLRVFNKCEYQLNVDVVDANDKTAKDDKMLYSIKNS